MTSELRQDGYDDKSRDIVSMAGLGVMKFKPGLTLPDGTYLINYQGQATTYHYFPIEEIFMDRLFWKTPKYDYGRIFKDKIVFVGPVAELFHDIHNTPYGLMPGLEIHAQIAGSLLQGTTLSNPPGWLALALSPGLGPKRILDAMQRLETPGQLFALGLTDLEGLRFPAGAAQFVFDGKARSYRV